MDIYSQVKQHLKLASDTEVASICGSLFKNFGIGYFSYNRVYADGTRFFLSTNHNFIDWIYENKLTVANSFNAYIKDGIYLSKLTSKFLPQQEAQKNDLQIIGGRNYFNVDLVEQGCNIIERPGPDYCEFFDFAGPVYDSTLIDFYTSNLDILKHFNNYFKAKANRLISKLDQNRIIDTIKSDKSHSSKCNRIIQINKNNFYNATQLDRLPIQNKYGKHTLTKQEVNCLMYLLRGRSAKQTAKALNISPKTVESYIDTAKQKLDCNNTPELIDKIIAINLFNPDYLSWIIAQEK